MIPFVNIHTHNSDYIDNKEFIEIQNIDIDDVVNVDVFRFYSIGIHPWDVSQRTTYDSQQTLSKLSQILILSDSQFLKAIGECGLDKAGSGNEDGSWNRSGERKTGNFEMQKEIFIKQIELSEHYSKPLIIHAVRTYPDIIAIRKETKSKQPWIIHGFQGNEQSAEQLLKHEGIYLSLGGVLFKNEEKSRRLLQIIPIERLFLETDIADRSIIGVYEKAAFLSGIEIEKLRSDIFNNFVKIFGQI